MRRTEAINPERRGIRGNIGPDVEGDNNVERWEIGRADRVGATLAIDREGMGG